MANGCESARSKQILFQHLKDKKIVDEVFSQMKVRTLIEKNENYCDRFRFGAVGL